MAADTWNPSQYERFRDERSQPFFDLLALVRSRPGLRVVDLGCGTGELTRRLHQHLYARETLGLDGSEAMLAKSQATASSTCASRSTALMPRLPETRPHFFPYKRILFWAER